MKLVFKGIIVETPFGVRWYLRGEWDTTWSLCKYCHKQMTCTVSNVSYTFVCGDWRIDYI